jgi:hypothetical protein
VSETATNQAAFLRFFHSDALRAETMAVLGTLEAAEDPTKHGEALAKIVLELTESGLDYYFLKPLRAARVGLVGQQSAKLGISTFLRVMGPVSRRIITGMNPSQLLAVTTHMRELMH